MAEGEMYVSLTSDHTDRKLESHSVARSKQPAPPRHHGVALARPGIDELVIRPDPEEGKQVYQEGS
jgi:hypothetical protein